MIRTIFCWFTFIFYTIFFGIIGLFFAVAIKKFVVPYAVRPWARINLWTAGIGLDVEGVENLPDEPCIIMFNHQSALDILAYMAVLPIDWRAIMKKEVGQIPFIGWVARISGHYLVARDGSSADTKAVKNIVGKIRSGPSVVIAPEGTRSKDGKLLPFQKGGFLIAVLSKVPVVPMIITGGLEILTKGSAWINPGSMKVKILPAIYVDDLPPGRDGREKLMQMVREQMAEVLGKEGYESD